MKPKPKVPVGGRRKSPPARGRGLKQKGPKFRRSVTRSPPARGRGLKLDLFISLEQQIKVAPRAGAWIETILLPCGDNNCQCRPPRGGVD